jgi:hypothetical protein
LDYNEYVTYNQYLELLNKIGNFIQSKKFKNKLDAIFAAHIMSGIHFPTGHTIAINTFVGSCLYLGLPFLKNVLSKKIKTNSVQGSFGIRTVSYICEEYSSQGIFNKIGINQKICDDITKEQDIGKISEIFYKIMKFSLSRYKKQAK